jgi:hypothetical protein
MPENYLALTGVSDERRHQCIPFLNVARLLVFQSLRLAFESYPKLKSEFGLRCSTAGRIGPPIFTNPDEIEEKSNGFLMSNLTSFCSHKFTLPCYF